MLRNQSDFPKPSSFGIAPLFWSVVANSRIMSNVLFKVIFLMLHIVETEFCQHLIFKVDFLYFQ